MSTASKSKNRAISLRLHSGELALVDRAAKLLGCSQADFVREAAVKEAGDAVLEQGLIQMSQDGFTAFVDAIQQPAEAELQLIEALRRSPPWK